MTVNKRKKNSRRHGKTTHGYGSRKKHRGAGNRGGRGMAGTGKRADQKKISIIKEYNGEYFGKHGFVCQTTKAVKTVNIEDLPASGEVNLRVLGIGKLLGKGMPKGKLTVIVDAVSKKAQEKIEKAGGKIVSE